MLSLTERKADFINIKLLNLIEGYGSIIPTLRLYYFGLGWVIVFDHWTKISFWNCASYTCLAERGKRGNLLSGTVDYSQAVNEPLRLHEKSRIKVQGGKN